jgi:hypothetical protein
MHDSLVSSVLPSDHFLIFWLKKSASEILPTPHEPKYNSTYSVPALVTISLPPLASLLCPLLVSILVLCAPTCSLQTPTLALPAGLSTRGDLAVHTAHCAPIDAHHHSSSLRGGCETDKSRKCLLQVTIWSLTQTGLDTKTTPGGREIESWEVTWKNSKYNVHTCLTRTYSVYILYRVRYIDQAMS